MRTCVRHMIVCVLYPRFELLAALGDRRALLAEPAALAPEAGREQVVGEVSAPAEAYGVVRGMRLGEAMSRCPALRLVAPDPEGVRSLWHAVLDRLEEIGAEVESDHAGAAFFAAAGLHGIHGGDLTGVLSTARRALGAGARFGVAPSRFASHAAALRVRPRRGRNSHVVVDAAVRDFLAPLTVALLRTRPELQALPEVLERLGIRTLGELAGLPSRAVAERFGHPGLLALDLSRGRDTPLDPRRPFEPVIERLDLPEAASGQQLERALELPAPSESLAVEVEAFGPPAHDQGRLLDEADRVRRSRLDEAVRQARQAAGADAALRVLDVDPDSRIPERRAVLAPFPDAS